MQKIKFGDGYAWFGGEDTPAPQEHISNPSPVLTLGVSAMYSGATVSVRYRHLGSSWQRLDVRKSTRTREAQYFTTRFPKFNPGIRVEYEVRVKSSGLHSISEQTVGEINWFQVVEKNSNRNIQLDVKDTTPNTSSRKRSPVSSNPAFASRSTSRRRITFPLQLPAQGEAVADLHQALSFLKFEVAQREIEKQSLGRTTRQAVLAFQKQQGLQATGQIDQRTSEKLNAVLAKAGYFPTKERPFQDRKVLRFKLREPQRLTPDTRNFVRQRLNTHLKEAILRQLRQPSEALQNAVRTMELNYEEVADELLSAVIGDRILPTLIENPALEEEIERLAEQKFSPSNEKVTELLYLDQDLRQHPFFLPETRRAKNQAIGRIVGLRTEQIEAIEDFDLDAAETATLTRLVDDGVLNEAEREELGNTIEFAKLTDDKFELIEALRTENRRTPRDLIALDRTDWLDLLRRNNVEPPEEDDLETYAKLINENIQRTFRTPYLMHQLVERDRESTLRRTADLQPLLERNDTLFVEGQINRELNWGGISETQRTQLQSSLNDLNRFANTYCYFGVAEILNNRKLNPDAKQQAIREKQTTIQRFHHNNPDLDLEWANFFNIDSDIGRAFQLNWNDISEEDRPQVRRFMMATQRVTKLTETSDEAEELMAQGLDSAIAIVNLPEKEFIKKINLPEPIAQRIYTRAANTAVYTGHFLANIEELTTHSRYQPAVTKGAEVPNLEIINVLKEIDGYQDLFGNQNYCYCEPCRSIFSPAAYFVDLMDFIHKNVSQPTFVDKNKTKHPLYLKNRRSDLWSLPLTCENTDTLIPYLTIVNEVLERYLEMVFEDDIYEALTTARLSFHQPFNLPFEELLLYLSHFQISLTNIYSLFSLPAIPMARARLHCSPEEFTTITTPDLEEVHLRYGQPENLLKLDVQSLIKSAWITRSELDRLLSLDFIKGLLIIEITASSKNNDLIGFTELMTFELGFDTRSFRLNMRVLVLHFLDRLHRFVRLWRKSSWTPEELQLIVSALIEISPFIPTETAPERWSERLGLTLNEDLVVNIAQLQQVQETFDISVEELYALFHEIPTTSIQGNQPSLFTRLFGAVETLTVQHPALNNLEDPDNPSVSPGFAQLQGALRLSESQLLTLLPLVLTPKVIQNSVFDRIHLSQLYRHARLARLMDIHVEDLQHVKTLLALSLNTEQPAQRIPQLLDLIRFQQALEETPFSVAEVWWLITDKASGNRVSKVTQAQIEQLLTTIRDDRQNRYFTPESLTEVGMTLANAQALITWMADPSRNWIERPNPDVEQYALITAYGLSPNFDAIAEFFTTLGNTAEVAQQKADDLQELLDCYHPRTLLIARLSEQFNINQAYFEALIPFFSTNPSDATFVSQLFAWIGALLNRSMKSLFKLVQELERRVYLFKEQLNLPAESLIFVAEHPDLFAIALPNTLVWNSLHLLSLYKRFLPNLSEEQVLYHQILLGWTGETFVDDVRSQLAQLLKTDLPQLTSLLENLVLPSQVIEVLAALSDALKMTAKLGLNGSALRQLTASTYQELTIASNVVQGAIKAKYDEKDWTKIIEPYQDKLNMIKRDALVDRVLSKEFQLKFSDTRELYQFFLLDVEMDGCARISRVKEAISACQLYVHRCRMNLEESETGDVHVFPERIPAEEWEWRKNYRVWEANRKVFVYPENWIEPDLRDDKTEIFKELESELLQQNITKEAVERAYRNYITKLDEVANLRIAGNYFDSRTDTYYLFGRTTTAPYQYFWRTFNPPSSFSEWKKINLMIESPYVAIILYRQRLFLFWLDIKVRVAPQEDNIFGEEYSHEIALKYSCLDITGRWSIPQGIENFYYATTLFPLSPYFTNNPHIDYLENSYWYRKLFIYQRSGDLFSEYHFRYNEESDDKWDVVRSKINLYSNVLEQGEEVPVPASSVILLRYTDALQMKVKIVLGAVDGITFSEGNTISILTEASINSEFMGMRFGLTHPIFKEADHLTKDIDIEDIKPTIDLVHNRISDSIIQLDKQNFLIWDNATDDVSPYSLDTPVQYEFSGHKMLRLSTSIAERMGEILLERGIDSLLALKTQKSLVESKLDIKPEGTPGNYRLSLPDEPKGHPDFKGAYGVYYRELFFHVPFLIANHLNANQKCEETDYWYRKIFDPTSSETPDSDNPALRNWQYVEFHLQEIPELRDILSNTTAIKQYNKDPFNPFAIARLRLSAFQKAIVMKYVDHLLDCGDRLFARDTFESINEATILYVMAADILGDRPVQAGECKTADESTLTYQRISSSQTSGSEFLKEIENSFINYAFLNAQLLSDLFKPDDEETPGGVVSVGSGFSTLRSTLPNSVMSYPQLNVLNRQRLEASSPDFSQRVASQKISSDVARQRSLVFCVPPNDILLGYWDRVADHLYKVQNCMNLQGVRREILLFEPAIDPGLLVRAKAAGLSLDDVLSLLYSDLPPYRFNYLIEKVKTFVATVQNFGSALLSALEKQDGEELNLLRARLEHELHKLIENSKLELVKEAEESLNSLNEIQGNAEFRMNHYQSLIDKGKNKPETDYTDNLEGSKPDYDDAAENERMASLLHQKPSISISTATGQNNFTSTGISFGGSSLGFYQENVAISFRTKATKSNIEASLDTANSTHLRRLEEWRFGRDSANRELTQIGKQILAAQARVEITKKDLESHQRQIEQAKELHDFYKDKFTNLGLYTYLSTSLSRLYREAYNMAHDLALKAQRAYQFETDDNTFFIGNDHWPADKAGFLAGERLLLDLQRMEQAYLEKNRREYEISLPFSLTQIDPVALLELRQNGSCSFTISEHWFALYYPGQYKCKIKSVRLTIPCVTGPYVNVSAKLTLLQSWMRREPHLGEQNFVGIPYQRNTSIAASTANNDAGVFELNFRDERYLPFEGAGAISEWRLELPSAFRPFDYNTITDVIIHISYTAKDDGRFKEEVEGALTEMINAQAEGEGLLRVFSAKHEFPGEWHQFLYPVEENAPHTLDLNLNKDRFPFLFHGKAITIKQIDLYAKPKGNENVSLPPVRLTSPEGIPQDQIFAESPIATLLIATLNFDHQISDPSIWTLELANGGLEAIDDIFITCHYEVQT